MAYDIPTTEPDRFRAGNTLTWLKTLEDFPASEGWVLYYRLINTAGKYDITATASGDSHLVEVAKATTATYTAGTYTLLSWVDDGTDRHDVGQQQLIVEVNLAAQASGYDTRSNAKQALDAVDAALLAYGSNAWTQEYEIAGRRMKFRTASDFLAFRSQLQAEVAAENNAERIRNGQAPRNKLLVRFK